MEEAQQPETTDKWYEYAGKLAILDPTYLRSVYKVAHPGRKMNIAIYYVHKYLIQWAYRFINLLGNENIYTQDALEITRSFLQGNCKMLLVGPDDWVIDLNDTSGKMSVTVHNEFYHVTHYWFSWPRK